MSPSLEYCISEITQETKFDTEGYLSKIFNFISYRSNLVPTLQEAQIKKFRVLKIPSYNKLMHDVEWWINDVFNSKYFSM
jgi:hypothetical protein